MTVAISKVSTNMVLPNKEQRSASAVGVIHDVYGGGHPLLPVEVEFDFDGSNEKLGWGYIETWGWPSSEPDDLFQAKIFVFDRDANFFKAVQKAAEHAALSGNQFLHLVFQRTRKKPYDAKTDQQEAEAEQERLSALMRRIDSGDKGAKMPLIEFDSIWVEDAIHTNAPAWSHAWIHDFTDRSMYHSRAAAKWRSMPWRQQDSL
ncbi:hypothetical protein [Novosphingobium naphthalenivorans]|uniref:hypothetical protein n=1 Tax=Novosphingobium naphthalenivorans TaxID=273168 RepID=UPI0014711805|nr:hypothetical protein [Novosphingobium naphthalenivorans]